MDFQGTRPYVCMYICRDGPTDSDSNIDQKYCTLYSHEYGPCYTKEIHQVYITPLKMDMYALLR